jgi:hypothetical protein
MGLFGKKLEIPSAKDALPGRSERMPVAGAHVVTGEALDAAFEGYGRILVAMGCFWGAERKFWQEAGVVSTSVGYVAGHTPNPTYEEVCSGRTGHTEAVLAIRETIRGPNIARVSTIMTMNRRIGRFVLGTPSSKSSPMPDSERSRPRSWPPRNTISPRTITSNISQRIRMGIVASEGQGSRVRSD